MATGRISGKSGKFMINSVQFHVNFWDEDAQADLPDATDSETNANEKEHVIGRRMRTFTVRGYVKTTDLPAAKIGAGVSLSTVEFYIDGSLKVAVPLMSSKSMKITAPIGSGETVGFEAVLVGNGTATELA